MQKKLGINRIDINKKFKDRQETYKYADRLRQFIKYNCMKKKYQAQAVIITSHTVGKASSLISVGNGKTGRDKKEVVVNNSLDSYYQDNYITDWHIHVLVVSCPSYSFMNDIKNYIDKNWATNKKEVYKK